MGMPVGIDVRDDADGIDAALDAAFGELRRADATFSTYQPGSEISRLGRGELTLEECSAEVDEVLTRCAELRDATDGFFSVRATGTLDPSGLVKGWAVDRAGALLDAAGARRWCIEAGGDVLTRGGRAPGRPWRVGIRHPRLRDRVCAVVAGDDLSVATSGAYERGAHVIDPHRGRPPHGVQSVTVVGPDLATADALATAAFAMGRRAPRWTAGLEGYEAMTILDGGSVLTTHGFPALLQWDAS
jgi:thiamine biosynthesis lipoprotein